MVGLGFGKQGGSKTKGGIPLFFFAPPLAGGCEKKKWGAKRKGGARTPRTPPEYASVFYTYIFELATLTVPLPPINVRNIM